MIIFKYLQLYKYIKVISMVLRKLGKVDDNIWLSLIAPRTAKSLKKTSYLWDGSYRSIFDKWKPNITFSDPCASTVDNNRYWDTVSCREKNSVICQKRDPSKQFHILHVLMLTLFELFCLTVFFLFTILK